VQFVVRDARRLQALRQLALLDTPAEEAFDRLTRLASTTLRAPVALVSLVDENRQFFKSQCGLPEPWAALRQTPLSHSFCQYVVATAAPLVIRDARNHPLVRENLAIPDLNVIAYAGIPLLTPAGDRLGSFCVIDHVPRDWTDEEVTILTDLAASVGSEIALRTTLQEVAAGAEASARLAAIIESSGDAIFGKTLHGEITSWNHAAERLYGYTVNEAVGRGITMLVPEDRPNEVPNVLARISRGERVKNLETIRCRKDGTQVEVSLSVSPIRGLEGHVVGAATIARDITERRRAEAALVAEHHATEEARARTQAVLDATGEAILLVGADGYFRMINRLFGEFFAVNPSEVVGRKVADLGEHLSRAIENPENFLTQVAGTASDAESVFTDTIVQKWPVPRELELTSVPVRAEAEFLGRLYAFRDVTRERESDRVKTEFLSMASHELRTPLTSIRGYVDLVLDGEAGEVSEHQREFLGVAKRNVDRLVKLVNDILDLSKMGAGRLQLQCEPVDVAAVLEHVVASLRPMMREIGQTLRMNVPPELPPVRGDQERLHQILFNLVSNAHKYTPHGGEITVAAHGGRSFVRVDVHDTGIGMSPQDLVQLFTRFFRSSNPAAQRAGGTGLGLSITRQLVELHGGTIDVHSALGAGSTFSFTLPVA